MKRNSLFVIIALLAAMTFMTGCHITDCECEPDPNAADIQSVRTELILR